MCAPVGPYGSPFCAASAPLIWISAGNSDVSESLTPVGTQGGIESKPGPVPGAHTITLGSGGCGSVPLVVNVLRYTCTASG